MNWLAIKGWSLIASAIVALDNFDQLAMIHSQMIYQLSYNKLLNKEKLLLH